MKIQELINKIKVIEEMQNEIYKNHSPYLSLSEEADYKRVSEWLLKYRKFLEGVSLSQRALIAFEQYIEITYDILLGIEFYFKRNKYKITVYKFILNDILWLDEDLRLDEYVINEKYILGLLNRYGLEVKSFYKKIFHTNRKLSRFEFNVSNFRVRLIEKLLADRSNIEDLSVYYKIWRNEASHLYNEVTFYVNNKKFVAKYNLDVETYIYKFDYQKLTNAYIIKQLSISEAEQKKYNIYAKNTNS